MAVNFEDIWINPERLRHKAVVDALTTGPNPGILANAIVMTRPADVSRARAYQAGLIPDFSDTGLGVQPDLPAAPYDAYAFRVLIPRIHGSLIKQHPDIWVYGGDSNETNNYMQDLTEIVAAHPERPEIGDLVQVRLRGYGAFTSATMVNLESGEYIKMVHPQYAANWISESGTGDFHAGTPLKELDWSLSKPNNTRDLCPTYDPDTRDECTGDPGTFPWSNRAKQHTARYHGTLIKNGELPDNVLVSDDEMPRSALIATLVAAADPAGPTPGATYLSTPAFAASQPSKATGAKLIKEAMVDWLKLAAAYEAKFNHTLEVSGYRTYAAQVNVRMIRVEGDINCPDAKFWTDTGWETNSVARMKSNAGTGAGQLNGSCKFVGFAGIPGTSNHGWGASVDISRAYRKWDHKTPEFRWLNRWSREYNFVFGVPGEHWHLDWAPFFRPGGPITDSSARPNRYVERNLPWTADPDARKKYGWDGSNTAWSSNHPRDQGRYLGSNPKTDDGELIAEVVLPGVWAGSSG